jgi:hypothetical protein
LPDVYLINFAQRKRDSSKEIMRKELCMLPEIYWQMLISKAGVKLWLAKVIFLVFQEDFLVEMVNKRL